MTGCGSRPRTVVQRGAGLAQREVERRDLEAPSGGSGGRRPAGARSRGRGRARRAARRSRRTSTRRRSGRTGRRSMLRLVRLGLVGHVLAAALLAARRAGRSWWRRARSPRRPCGPVARARRRRSSAAGRRSSHRATWADQGTLPAANGSRAARSSSSLVEVVGLTAAPLTALVFGRLPGAGLGFTKIFGLLLVTWLVWMAASLHVVRLRRLPLIIGVLVLLAVSRPAVGAAVAARWASGWPRGDAVAAVGRGSRCRRRSGAPAACLGAPRSSSRSAAAMGRCSPSYVAGRLGHREADGHGVHQRRSTPRRTSRRTTRG